MIRQSVMSQAEEEAQKLKDQAKELEENALRQAREEAARELSGRERDEAAEIRLKAAQGVSQQETKERRELLLRREEITRRVFDQVRKRLADHVETGEYPRLLEETAKVLAEKCPREGCVVLLRQEDLPLAKKLTGYFGGDARAEADESIRIGGIKVMNQAAGLFLDESLDSRLEDQKAWFYANSGLTV